MTNLSCLTRSFYLKMLAAMGVVATWVALISTSSCVLFVFYQPKMPQALIRMDE